MNALLVACHFYAVSKKNTLNLANGFGTALRLVYPCGTIISVRKQLRDMDDFHLLKS